MIDVAGLRSWPREALSDGTIVLRDGAGTTLCVRAMIRPLRTLGAIVDDLRRRAGGWRAAALARGPIRRRGGGPLRRIVVALADQRFAYLAHFEGPDEPTVAEPFARLIAGIRAVPSVGVVADDLSAMWTD